MSELFFCLKTLVLTIALVMVMQIRVGEQTLESHAMAFFQSSSIVTPLNSVAQGAGKLFEDAKTKLRFEAFLAKRKMLKD
jgi:hypothetical protein